MILSEYGIAAVKRPVHLNRVLRQDGFVVVRDEMGRELLDPGASPAFAVADHQVAHIYVNDKAQLHRVRRLLESTPGVGRMLDEAGKAELHLDHPRSGDLVALAEQDSWFTYYYWLDEARMPDFARTVDIHRKPGYDPVELFLNPTMRSARLYIGATLLKKKLGFRYLLEVIPTDATLVRGSHGLAATSAEHGPLLITHGSGKLSIAPTEVGDAILRLLFPVTKAT